MEHTDLITILNEHAHGMEVRTMAEAIAGTLLEQGIEQGETRAKRNAILKLLQSRFSNVPETLTTRINAIHSHAQLDKLFDEILAAETLDDIHL